MTKQTGYPNFFFNAQIWQETRAELRTFLFFVLIHFHSLKFGLKTINLSIPWSLVIWVILWRNNTFSSKSIDKFVSETVILSLAAMEFHSRIVIGTTTIAWCR